MKIVLAITIGLVTLIIAACSTNTPASEPTAPPVPPLALVTDTQRTLPIEETQVTLSTETPTDVPTATETPTNIESETTTETPTATPTLILPPIVFFPPADGGMSISAYWSEN